MIVDTGDGWGPRTAKTIVGLQPPCSVVRFGDLAGGSVNWPDPVQGRSAALPVRREPFRLRPHLREAFDDVLPEFEEHDRG